MTEQNVSTEIPDGFTKIINDFIDDILITFPEYKNVIQKWWNLKDTSSEKLIDETVAINNIFKHCVRVFPERFFDILNKNDEIFNDDSTCNTEFLPGIVFRHLWKCDISLKTKDTIWKYLQLILFSIINSVSNSSELGDTAKMFENVDENVLRSKLEETMENMKSMFENIQPNNDTNDTNESGQVPHPSAEDIHSHLNDIMKGKLGKLAMEFAEETAQELNLDMENNKDAQSAFQNMFKNPTKLMSVVKNVGAKLDSKIKSGELTESEIISEGMDILNKMKNVPGMENIQSMMSQMGLGKNGKMNMNAMESQMQQNLKMAQMRERMKKKAETKTNTENVGKPTIPMQPTCSLTDDQIANMFNDTDQKSKSSESKKKKSNKDKTDKKDKKDNKDKKDKKEKV
jgi:hypothetical protein